MAYNDKRLILASASPRRRELLDRFGVPYEILPARGEEHSPPGLSPGETVARLAENRPIDEVIGLVEGIRCGFKPTSCPDQLAQALKEIKAQQTA